MGHAAWPAHFSMPSRRQMRLRIVLRVPKQRRAGRSAAAGGRLRSTMQHHSAGRTASNHVRGSGLHGRPRQERAGGIRKSPQCSAHSQADAEVAAGLLAGQMVVLLDLLLGDLIGVAPAARWEAGRDGGRHFAARQSGVQNGERRRGRARGYSTRSWARSSPSISERDGGATSRGSGAGLRGRRSRQRSGALRPWQPLKMPLTL